MSNVNAVVTLAGRRKLVMARAGDLTLPPIAGIAFGDGGVDLSGEVITPTSDQATLNHEIGRKPIGRHSFPVETTCRYEVTLPIGAEFAGARISEIGLYDTENDIIAIKNFLAKGKDADMELTVSIDDIF